MSGFLGRHLKTLLHRSRSPSRDRGSPQTNTTTTPHHVVEFVKSADGLTYIAPPYMVGVPVAQWTPKPTSVAAADDTAAASPIPLEPSRLLAKPVLTGWNAEPSIVRGGSEFFLTTASGTWFPGLPIYRSSDLVNWELVGHGMSRKEQWIFGDGDGAGEEKDEEKGTSEEGIQNPSLRERDGVFYLLASWIESGSKGKNLPRNFYIRSNNILDDASWSDPIFCDVQGMGQDLYWDHDGKAYLITTGCSNPTPLDTINRSTVSTSEIGLATGKSLTEPITVQSNDGTLLGVSRVIKRADFYYLFTTEVMGTSNQGCVSRSEQGPFPPWKPAPANTVWHNGPEEEVQDVSHIDVFEDADGKWWAVLSGTSPRKVYEKWSDSVLGQETFLVTVEWKDHWPIFNSGKSISLVTPSHSEKLKTPKAFHWYSDFSKPKLEIGWYQLYPPRLSPRYTLVHSTRSLRLEGNVHNLSSSGRPALVVRKQTTFRQAWKTLLTFKPTKRGSEAGIVVWVSRFAYCALGIHLTEETEEEGKMATRVVSLTGPDEEGGMGKKIVQKLPKYDCVVGLDVEAKDDGYYFSVSTQKDYDYVVCSVSCQALMESAAASPGGRGGSAGAMFGLYAFADGESCSDAADFGNVLMYSTDRS